MAINKNHEFEDLSGVKCAVVEKNATQERIDFLKPLLELNGYSVVVVASPPPKAATAPKPAESETPIAQDVPAPPSTYTIGVTDVRFNVINALMGRMLKTKDGSVVTVDFWNQKEVVSHDNIPYFSNDEYIHSWK